MIYSIKLIIVPIWFITRFLSLSRDVRIVSFAKSILILLSDCVVWFDLLNLLLISIVWLLNAIFGVLWCTIDEQLVKVWKVKINLCNRRTLFGCLIWKSIRRLWRTDFRWSQWLPKQKWKSKVNIRSEGLKLKSEI